MEQINIPLPKSSLEKLLKPVSRLTDSCVLKSKEDYIFTVCSSSDNSIILYAKTQLPNVVEEPVKINLNTIKKFVTGLSCLGTDGEFQIILNDNHLICKMVDVDSNEDTFFKYHLVDDGIIKESPVNTESIKSLSYDTIFEIPVAKVKQIMSAYTYANDINKIYFYTKDQRVYAKIDDDTLQNKDSVSIMVNVNFTGTPLLPTPIKTEVFKMFAFSKSDIKVYINNEHKVLIFQTQEDDNTDLKYIISALVK